MTDTLSLFRTFVRVVEAGSFTAVAEEMNTSQPTVSRQVAALEDHLGCLLFQRTTRALTLTDDGRIFYGAAQAALDAAVQAESAVGRRRGRATGRLRLAVAGVFGRLHVIPRLPAFMERHPEIEVDLVMHDRFADMIEEGIDLALRVGKVTDSGLVARTIGLSRRSVLAAPSYLERHGTPRQPKDLKAHRCIVYSGLLAGRSWGFEGPGGHIDVPITGPFSVDNTEGVRAAVLQGMGIGYVPIWHFVEDEIESGRLVVLLRGYEGISLPITAVYPSRRHLAPKVRAAIDFFAAEFHLDPKLSAAAV
jgi:DNA-binding transcriptional LysR family regulator